MCGEKIDNICSIIETYHIGNSKLQKLVKITKHSKLSKNYKI